MLTINQLANRKLGIGGSDAPSILRIQGAFSTPLAVYQQKVFGTTTEVNSFMKLGNDLENVVFKRAKEIIGIDFHQPEETFYHKDHNYLLANVDGLSDNSILEIKVSTSEEKWKSLTKVAETQVRHYMSVLDKPIVYIALLLGKKEQLEKTLLLSKENKETKIDLKIFKVERDYRYESVVNTACLDFWNDNVLRKKPPAIFSKEDYTKRSTFKNGKTIASNSIGEDIAKIKAINKQIAELEKTKEPLNIKIVNEMNGNNKLVNEDNEVVANIITSTKESIDIEALKAAHPDIYEQFCKKTTFNSLRVK